MASLILVDVRLSANNDSPFKREGRTFQIPGSGLAPKNGAVE